LVGRKESQKKRHERIAGEGGVKTGKIIIIIGKKGRNPGRNNGEDERRKEKSGLRKKGRDLQLKLKKKSNATRPSEQ